MTASTRIRALKKGGAALTKATILAFGVPVAIERLWVVAGTLNNGGLVADESLWIRAVLVGVAALWCRALLSLFADLRRALHGNPLQRTNWSSRWATSIAALALIVTAGHASSTRGPVTPVTQLVVQHQQSNAQQHPSAVQKSKVDDPGNLQPGECLAELANRTLNEPEAWPRLAAMNMGAMIAPGQRFVDPSLLRVGWCLTLPSGVAPGASAAPRTPGRSDGRNVLEELAWLGLGVVGTASLVRRVRTLRVAARAARQHGQRSLERDPELEALEARLEPFGDAILIDWIEAANRLLRVETSDLGVAPVLLLSRAGPAGVTFYFDGPVAAEPKHFIVGMSGWSWMLPASATLDDLETLSATSGRYVPWLIPVGDDGEDAWLVAVGPGKTLEIAADEATTAEVLSGISAALRTLPWAEELSIELLGLEAPPAEEHCYQMADSSAAALIDLVSAGLGHRSEPTTPPWRREPLVVSCRSSDVETLPETVMAAAGVVRPGTAGSMRLEIDGGGARLVPVGVALNVPRPTPDGNELIDRLLARAASNPSVVPLRPMAPPERPYPSRSSSDGVRLVLLGGMPQVFGLRSPPAERDAARVTELLSYVVLHEGSVTSEELMHALFPRAGARGTRRLDDVLAATRHALGQRRLVITAHGAVTLEVDVSSDWTDLLATLHRARVALVPETMSVLGEVLTDLTWQRSAPFRWMTTEGLVDQLSFAICDSMHQLASLAFAEGDLDLMARSLTAGLRIEATSELLVRDLMLLRHRIDGAEGVIESYAQLEEALAANGGVEPSWTTRALFDDLAGEHA